MSSLTPSAESPFRPLVSPTAVTGNPLCSQTGAEKVHAGHQMHCSLCLREAPTLNTSPPSKSGWNCGWVLAIKPWFGAPMKGRAILTFIMQTVLRSTNIVGVCICMYPLYRYIYLCAYIWIRFICTVVTLTLFFVMKTIYAHCRRINKWTKEKNFPSLTGQRKLLIFSVQYF